MSTEYYPESVEGPKHSLVTLHEISVFRSGSQPVRVLEHNHPEIQVSVRLPAHGKLHVTEPVTYVAASREPHSGILDGETELLIWYFMPEFIYRTAYDAFGKSHAEVHGNDRTYDPFLRETGAVLLKELRRGEDISRLFVESLTLSVVGHLVRKYTTEPVSSSQSREKLRWREWKQAQDFIHANLSQDLTLAQVASEVAMSSYRFARLFRASSGISPAQFILKCRLDEAQRLLLRTNLTVGAIAAQTGFHSQSHFTRTFHARFGVSPSAFRQK